MDRESLSYAGPLPAEAAVAEGRQWPAMVAAAVIFAALSLAVGLASKGFIEADACTHYMYSRFAFREPQYLVNVWGRPVCTALYAVPAVIGGRLGTQLTSLSMALICAMLTYAIARGQRYRWPALAFIFLLAQPFVFLHSFNELTELPFATLLAGTFLAYQRRQWLVMAVLLSLGPATRPEGFGFLLLGAAALIAHRKWWWLTVLPLGLVIWNFAGWAMDERTIPWWAWLKESWPYAAESMYGAGNPLHFVMAWPVFTSPFMFPAMGLGVYWSFAGRKIRDHRGTCQWLIAIIPLTILVGHSVLYAMGKMASSGELRYMATVAPFWALLAAKGWEWVFTDRRWSHPFLWAGVASLLPILANVAYPALPIGQFADGLRSERIAKWYRGSELEKSYPRVAASHPGVYYCMDLSFTDPERSQRWMRSSLGGLPAGTIVIWDPVFGVYNADEKLSVTLSDLMAAGWIYAGSPEEILSGSTPADLGRKIAQARPFQDWCVFLSPQAVSGQPTPYRTESMQTAEGVVTWRVWSEPQRR